MREVTCYTKESGNYVKIDVDPEVASKAYKDYASRNIREFDLRVKFNKKTLSSSDIVSIRINSDLFTTDSFTIGSVVAETLELTIYMDTVFGTDDFIYVDEWVIDEWRPIIPYVLLRTEIEIQTEYGFELKEVWQEVNLGPFYINPDGVNEDGTGVMSIRASSLLTHPKYGNKTIEFYSKTDRDLPTLINNAYGTISNEKVSFTLLNEDIPPREEIIAKYDNIEGMTVREAINYVAILYGGFARTIYKNDRVYLEFFRKQETDYVFDESNYVFLTRSGSGSGLSLSELKCKISNTQTLIVGGGADTTETIFLECPDMTEERLKVILAEFKGYGFRPTTTKIFGNPMLQVGDITIVKGRGINSGGAYFPLHSIVYNITGSGITMDVKSLFKVNEIVKKEKQAEEDNKEENKQENLQQSLDELYDRTTIQYEDKDKNLPLITLKEDYLESKDSLEQSIQSINGNYTSLSTQINSHINDKEAHSAGEIDLNSLTVQELNFDVPGDTSADHYASIVCTKSIGDDLRGIRIRGARHITFWVGQVPYMTLEGTWVNMSSYASFSGLNMNNQFIKKARFLDCDPTGLTGELSEQSEYTSLLAECEPDENKTHISMTYDSDELRWCWKETTFTYAESDIDPETDKWVYTGRYICYIELPIFMAENIENNYHINVSKMSWGDYRIIEKTPYYFILESQEDNFAFTFEVVAKLTDNDNQ